MFSGAILVNLDSKGRMSIPTRYRENLSEGMVCTIGLYHSCLTLYSMFEWMRIEQQLSTLSTIIESERRIKRLLLGYAAECFMDNSGRILIPSTLRTYAKLEKHIMFVGQSNKFEIWDEAIWYQQISEDIAALPVDIENLSDNLKNLTI
ncbi:cell division/cell wall cluster transcriptional repressor MraZ [Gilliamella sp. Choc4-2]|jgi:MraZ protein|uniref:division/cell wall cluster transcriptional repressor MraZ n=1 Tax=unclassified Gilliamella TaxID=2685620 RepID=UPI0004DD1AA5|nr:division/cell wall cluster transcriptional repressor MraZ [Gilliamella apicola]KFA59843.1 Cell division protein MraZ [Gilliamella apicola]OCG30355.1 cell division/cell wall cluster transcriptional repressor MraZ [Gilliamella apicola]OCG47295.1 cell division/cell wall cluster transcriptional repressor MraZ [Gilliamella apicola]OCG55409.1 cell division/cell wall cluster transcriptional repressor MraZ [Gilliamella apicola]OCG63090.1 cell division/cell wall cluster transcriptional repressor Mra